VSTLTQTDGNNLSFGYQQVGSVFKLATYTDAAKQDHDPHLHAGHLDDRYPRPLGWSHHCH